MSAQKLKQEMGKKWTKKSLKDFGQFLKLQVSFWVLVGILLRKLISIESLMSILHKNVLFVNITQKMPEICLKEGMRKKFAVFGFFG